MGVGNGYHHQHIEACSAWRCRIEQKGGQKIITKRDTNLFSEVLRRKSVNLGEKSFLVADFTGSVQKQDMSLPPNCRGFGRIHHYRSDPVSDDWMPNPLPMLPASEYLRIPAEELAQAQTFQLAACDFDCWYCYTDKNLRTADTQHASFKTAHDLLSDLDGEEGCDRPSIINLSGGQPDIVPEFTLWFLEEREAMGLDKKYFIWTDDNLSNDHIWRYLTREQIEFMAQAPGFARVGCLKGFDPDSFAFNTGADKELFYKQIDVLGRLVAEGFDQYGYVTLTTLELAYADEKIAELFDILQDEIHPDFPLRIVPLPIAKFTVNSALYYDQAVANQHELLEIWKAELRARFTREELRKPMTKVSIET